MTAIMCYLIVRNFPHGNYRGTLSYDYLMKTTEWQPPSGLPCSPARHCVNSSEWLSVRILALSCFGCWRTLWTGIGYESNILNERFESYTVYVDLMWIRYNKLCESRCRFIIHWQWATAWRPEVAKWLKVSRIWKSSNSSIRAVLC